MIYRKTTETLLENRLADLCKIPTTTDRAVDPPASIVNCIREI